MNDSVDRTNQRVSDREGIEAPPDGGTIYTCPMHAQIRQATPGNCPIRGLALEPLMSGLEQDANPELRDFSRHL